MLWFLQYRLRRLVVAWWSRSGRFNCRCGDGYLRWEKWFGHSINGRAEWLPKSIGWHQLPHPKVDDRHLSLGSGMHTNDLHRRSRIRPMSLYARLVLSRSSASTSCVMKLVSSNTRFRKEVRSWPAGWGILCVFVCRLMWWSLHQVVYVEI